MRFRRFRQSPRPFSVGEIALISIVSLRFVALIHRRHAPSLSPGPIIRNSESVVAPVRVVLVRFGLGLVPGFENSNVFTALSFVLFLFFVFFFGRYVDTLLIVSVWSLQYFY